MKHLTLFRVMVLALSLFAFACNSSDEPTDGGGNNNGGNNNGGNTDVTSITIASDVSTLVTGETATFTVTSNLSTDVTSSATISIDGNAISGSTFTPASSGVYSVSASLDGLSSNTLTIVVDPELVSIVLEASSTSVFVGDQVTFNVTGNDAADYTAQSSITVDAAALGGSSFDATATGVYEFVATYDAFTSNTVQVTVNAAPTTFNQRVLIEDYTGTWCGYCPRVAYGIELVHGQTTDAVAVAIHRGSTNPSSGSYDPYNYNAGTLEDLVNLSGYPTAMLNRTTDWNYPEPNNVNQVTNLATGEANVGLALSPSLSGNTISLDVDVKFGGLFTSTNAKLVVYVLEDGLTYNQANYTSYYSGQNPIPSFTHNDVLRESLTNLLGDAIPGSDIVPEGTYTRTFSVGVPANVTNSANMTVVAFVVDGVTNATLNVRAAHFGDTQTFEEL